MHEHENPGNKSKSTNMPTHHHKSEKEHANFEALDELAKLMPEIRNWKWGSS